MKNELEKEIESRERNLLGLPIHDFTMPELMVFIKKSIKAKAKYIIFGISAGAYGRLKMRQDLARIYFQMDVNIAEGGGIPVLARLFGVKIREHVGLVNVMFRSLELADTEKYKVLLFGASQEVNDLANNEIRKRFPGVHVCQGINGYFNKEDEVNIVKQINREQPDLLYIGITYPIKERFAVTYKDQLNTKIIIPCGGAFEVLAGRAKRPPFKLKWIPITWFYRFIQEPRRLFKPVLITVLYTSLWLIPVMLVKHMFRIERNPSIITFFKLPKNGSSVIKQ